MGRKLPDGSRTTKKQQRKTATARVYSQKAIRLKEEAARRGKKKRVGRVEASKLAPTAR